MRKRYRCKHIIETGGITVYMISGLGISLCKRCLNKSMNVKDKNKDEFNKILIKLFQVVGVDLVI